MPRPAPSIWYLWPLFTAIPFVLGPLLAHTHLVAPFRGFLIFVASALPALVAIGFGAYLVLTGNSGKGLVCVMVGALPVAALASGLATGRKYPRINDITTNVDLS